MRRHNYVLVAALAAAVSPAAAQRVEPDVVAGLPVKFSSPAKPDTIVYRRFTTRAGKDSSTGTRTVVVRAQLAGDGTPMTVFAQRFPAKFGEIVDTSIAHSGSLRALAHRSYQPATTMRFVFTGGNADGEIIS